MAHKSHDAAAGAARHTSGGHQRQQGEPGSKSKGDGNVQRGQVTALVATAVALAGSISRSCRRGGKLRTHKCCCRKIKSIAGQHRPVLRRGGAKAISLVSADEIRTACDIERFYAASIRPYPRGSKCRVGAAGTSRPPAGGASGPSGDRPKGERALASSGRARARGRHATWGRRDFAFVAPAGGPGTTQLRQQQRGRRLDGREGIIQEFIDGFV